MPRLGKIHWWGLVRWAICRLQPRTLVLAYHHVCPAGQTAPWITVAPEEFGEQMDYLARSGMAAPITDLLADLRRGQLSAGARVVVTFDDASVDFVEQAYPVLRRHGVPATLFVPTGLIGSSEPFWWNRLYLLDQSENRNGACESWRDLRFLDSATREQALRNRARQTGCDARPASPRPMTWDEIANVDRGLVTFGAHSCSHPALSGLDDAAIDMEVQRSRDELRRLRSFLPVFAYPYGDAAVVDKRVKAAVRKAGFEASFTTVPRRVLPRQDRMSLGRFCMSGMNLDEFRWLIDYHLSR